MMYGLYRFGQWLALCLPRSLAYRVGVFLTGVKFFFSPGERRTMLSNLRVITGKDDRFLRQYPWHIYVNFGRYLVDFFRAEEINRAFVDKFIRIKNLEHMDAALQKGKGVLGLTAHIGNWELCAQAMAILGYKMNAIALTHMDKRIDDFFSGQRKSKGIKVIPVGVSVRQCFAALKRNEIVGILGDRDFSGEHGIVVDFFGKPMLAPRGAALLSLRTDAAIVPAFVIRDERDPRYFTYSFEEPIYPQRSGHEENDIRALTEKYIKVIENYVRQYPKQWFMFHEFWKPAKAQVL